MLCPDCGAQGYSPFALWCTKCGASLRFRRPRVEVVPGLPARVRQVDSVPALLGSSEPGQGESPDPRGSETLAETETTAYQPSAAPSPPVSGHAENIDTGSSGSEPGEPARQNAEQLGDYLIVNHAEIVRQNCSACGGPVAPRAQGEVVLFARIDGAGDYLFCVGCGNNIMSHLASDGTAPYSWDWALSLQTRAGLA